MGVSTDLLLHLLTHYLVVFSFAILFYLRFGKITASAVVILVGVFIDLDHVIDYFLAFGFHWWPEGFFAHAYTETGKAFIFFHGWDLIALLFLIGFRLKNVYVLAIAAGMFSHLLIDQLIVARHPLTYVLSYRLLHGFSTESFRNFQPLW